jgi:hypothetical protein
MRIAVSFQGSGVLQNPGFPNLGGAGRLGTSTGIPVDLSSQSSDNRAHGRE